MLRRTVLVFGVAAIACLTGAPITVRSQPKAGQLRRIGLLWAGTTAENASRRSALLLRLRELGWIEPQTIALDELWAEGHYDQLPALASDMAARRPEVILALNGTPAAVAAMKASRDIPIVAPAVGDPVAAGLASSLAVPGGNVTGSTNLASELYSKRLALLKETMPDAKRAALVMNDGNAYTAIAERLSLTTGRSLGIELRVFHVRDSSDFEKTFEEISRVGVDAALVGGDILFQGNVGQLGELALRHRLPLMGGYHAPGVLVAYNVDNIDLYRRAASYVDRILKGAKAGELPFEQPSRFTLFVDLKTARTLGVAIPQSVLVRADEVIQ